jgi:hypothetical protein
VRQQDAPAETAIGDSCGPNAGALSQHFKEVITFKLTGGWVRDETKLSAKK